MKQGIFKATLFFCILTTSLFGLIVCKGSQVNQTNHFTSSLERILLNAKIPQLQFQIINSFPHDRHSFTEGLVLENSYLYESTGLYGYSKLRKIEMTTGKVVQEYNLNPHYFGEGITIFNNKIYQLTYREHTGFVYDKTTFALQKTFNYSTEGWGLTSDDKQLIMSNGSATLSFIDPTSLQKTHSIVVNVKGQKISSINELEYVNGKIYANVFPGSIIIIISPDNGQVEGWFDIKKLRPTSGCIFEATDCVANGVTYDEQNNTVIVTGKNWPNLFEIKLNN